MQALVSLATNASFGFSYTNFAKLRLKRTELSFFFENKKTSRKFPKFFQRLICCSIRQQEIRLIPGLIHFFQVNERIFRISFLYLLQRMLE